MSDPLQLADKLDYEGGSLVLHTTDDVGETIHRISIPAELAAAALRLAEKIEDPWVRVRHPWWRCTICGAECEWDEESEFHGTHRPGCEWAAYDAAKEGS